MARILILEDDLAALAVARRAVRAAGHDALAVTSAADAVASLAASPPPDVLLVAPAADAGEGLALAERTRADPARAGTAVLLIGDAASGIPAVARPLDGLTVGASIARALAGRAPAPPTTPPQSAAPARRAGAGIAEAALRALFRRSPPASPPEPSPSPAPVAAAEPAAPGPREGIPARPLPDLPTLLRLARSADYFAVLSISRTASGVLVRDAAARILGHLDAIRLTGGAADAVELAEVRQVVLDARDVLVDDEVRGAYLKGIEDVAEPAAS